MTGHTDDLDQPLLAEMIAGPRIGWPVSVIHQVAAGDHSERADARERARFGAAQRVLAAPMEDDLPLEAAR
jgi:hypothetical protein